MKLSFNRSENNNFAHAHTPRSLQSGVFFSLTAKDIFFKFHQLPVLEPIFRFILFHQLKLSEGSNQSSGWFKLKGVTCGHNQNIFIPRQFIYKDTLYTEWRAVLAFSKLCRRKFFLKPFFSLENLAKKDPSVNYWKVCIKRAAK